MIMPIEIYYLIGAVAFTIFISALCSILEAMILSTTTAEVEALKKSHPVRGKMLETYKLDIEETSSAILSLNTVANTAGASISGALAATALGEANVIYFSAGLVLAILIFSEVIPKNVGVIYRPSLQPILVFPLQWIRWVMTPISFFCKSTIRFFVRYRPDAERPEEEIILLASKSAKEGDLTESEKTMISNALSLDDIPIGEIMTPRTVMTSLDESLIVDEVFRDFKNIPFARIPVYKNEIDEMVGVVRRRDLLSAMARGEGDQTVGELKSDAIFIPENAVAADALQIFLKNNQQLAIVVDEYGSVAGVLTMEDIMESILGQEIFEHDDVAIDMRELARKKSEARKRRDLKEWKAEARANPVGESGKDEPNTEIKSEGNEK